MLNPLSERAQRWIIVGLILLLLVFGVYFALGGFEGGTTTDEPQGQDTAQETPGGGGAPGDPEEFSTVPPSPLPRPRTKTWTSSTGSLSHRKS